MLIHKNVDTAKLESLRYNFADTQEKGVMLEASGKLAEAAKSYEQFLWFVRTNNMEELLYPHTHTSIESLANRVVNLYARAGMKLYSTATYVEEYYGAATLLERAAYICKEFGVGRDRLQTYAAQAVKIYILNEHAFHGLNAAIAFDLREDIVKKARSKAGQWAHEKYDHYMKFGDRLMKEKEYFNAVFEYREALTTAKEYLTWGSEVEAATKIVDALKMGVNALQEVGERQSIEYARIALSAEMRADLIKEYDLDPDSLHKSLKLAYKMYRLKIQDYIDLEEFNAAENALIRYREFCSKYVLPDHAEGFEAQLLGLKGEEHDEFKLIRWTPVEKTADESATSLLPN